MTELHKVIKKRKYEILLTSLLLLLFGNLIVPSDYWAHLRPILLIQNMTVGLILFFEQKKWRNILMALIIISLEFTQYFIDSRIHVFTGITYMLYFLLLSIKIYKKIYKAKAVGKEVISAVFCGFIMLTMIGSFIFILIEVAQPNSFSNLGLGINKYQNIQYYSFITTLTIGFGDIVPLTHTAKQMTILMALAGNFYSVIVTGIVLGKFINKNVG
jgi:voltage-gated potassium channel